jgi:hypothetical protein
LIHYVCAEQELSFRLELLDEDNDTLQQDNNLLKQNLKVLGDELQAARSSAAETESKVHHQPPAFACFHL